MYTLVAKVRRWGNSYGVRLRKKDLQALGIREGSSIDVQVRPHRPARGLDLSDLPTFRDPDPLASIRHDEYLYRPRPPKRGAR